MGVRGEQMRSSPIKQGRRNRWEDSRCAVGPQRERWTFGLAAWRCSSAATRGQQSAEPGAEPRGCPIPVAHGPDTLGPPRQMASLPHPAYAFAALAPGVHQLLFAWRSSPLASSEMAAPPLSPSRTPGTSEAAAFVFLLPSGKGISLGSHQVTQACV